MAEENRNKDKTQRSNQEAWSSDPTHTPGQQAGNPNPSDTQYDKTEPMRRTNRDPGTPTRPDEYQAGGTGGSQTPNQGSRPGDPRESDDDDVVGKPNVGDDEDTKRGGMGRGRDTDPGKPGEGGIGGSRGGMGGGMGEPNEEDR